MKNRSFLERAHFAIAGIKTAFKLEASFRTQLLFSSGALVLLLVLRPKPIWWATLALTVSGVLAAELFNTALESVMDQIHPEHHPLIGRAKDCAAGAVLILSLASLGVACALVWDFFNH